MTFRPNRLVRIKIFDHVYTTDSFLIYSVLLNIGARKHLPKEYDKKCVAVRRKYSYIYIRYFIYSFGLKSNFNIKRLIILPASG